MNIIMERFITLRRELRDWDWKTERDYRQILGRYNRWLTQEGLDFAKVDEEDFLRYWRDLRSTYKVATANQHLVKIRAVYTWALRKKGIEIECDPTMEIVLLRDDHFHNAALYSPEHLRKMHAAIKTPTERVIFYLLAFTGMRRKETMRLKWENVEWENDILNVFGKGRKWRRVPIHPLLREVLEVAYDPDETYLVNAQGRTGMSEHTFNEKTAKLIDRAGVPRFERPVHAFRATFNQNLADELGADGDLIRKRIMGHGSKGDVNEQHYRAVHDEKMHQAILALYKNDPITRGKVIDFPQAQGQSAAVEK